MIRRRQRIQGQLDLVTALLHLARIQAIQQCHPGTGISSGHASSQMESLLMQLAMAALSQFGGGGFGGGGFGGGGFGGGGMGVPFGGGYGMPTRPRPITYPQAPVMRPAPAPIHTQGPAMQASTLAATTCLLRNGELSRQQAITMLDRQGQRMGWAPGWGRSIPVNVVDRTIAGAGGCRALLASIRSGYGSGPTQMAGSGLGSRSQQEGFGLYPYR